MPNVGKTCIQHGNHAGIASITPHLRAYRFGTRECYYILYLMANYVQDIVGSGLAALN